MVFRTLQALVIALGLFAVAGLPASVHPLLEASTNIRAQVAFLALVPLIGFALYREPVWATTSFVLFVWLVSALVPYLAVSADPLPADGRTVRVMQYNVYFGNEDHDAVADHILAADAQVVALHEPLPEQWESLEPRLARAYPHILAQPLAEADGQPGGGMVLLSRTPLRPIEMPAEASPRDRVILVAETEIDGRTVTVIGLHPHASRTEERKVTLRQAQIDAVADLVDGRPGPAVILTDLNVAPTSPAYGDFVDRLGWRDPHRLVGWRSTWPAWGGRFGVPIDHIFVSNHFALHDYEMGDGAGSDHRSLVAVLSWREH